MNESERRTHSREDTVVPIVLRVELHGFDDRETRFEACGQTVNVSCGGMLARVDCALPPGAHCVVHFPDAMELLGRTLIYGTVRRNQPEGDLHEIALLFDTPLQEVEISQVGQTDEP